MADRIESSDSQALARALTRPDRWLAQSGVSAAERYRRRWRDLIAEGVPATTAQLRADGDDADTMRSCAPFLDVVSPAERATLLALTTTARTRDQ